MAQQLGTVIYAFKNLPNIIGKTIVVVGQGSAGLWFNFVLKRLGAKKIIGIDKHDHRNKMSKSFGATDFVNNIKNNPIETVKELNNGKLADIVVLDRNLFKIPKHEIHSVKVNQTIFNGKIVYEKD